MKNGDFPWFFVCLPGRVAVFRSWPGATISAYKAAVRWGFQGIPLGLGQNHDEPLVFGAILARTHTHTHTQTWWFPIFRGTPSHHLF